MMDMQIKKITPKEYRDFIDMNALDYKMLQAPEYAALRKGTIYAGLNQDGRISHAVIVESRPAMKMWNFAYSAAGYLSANEQEDKAFLDALAQALKKDKYILWQMESSKELREYDRKGNPVEGGRDNRDYLAFMEADGFTWTDLGQGYNPAHQMTWQSRIDLTDKKDFDQIWAGFTGNRRRDVKYARKNNLTFEVYKPGEMNEELWQAFGSLMEKSADYQGYDDGTLDSHKNFLNAYGDDHARIGIVWTQDHEPAYAGAWILSNGQMMYLYSGMDRAFSKLCPTALAQATMIEKALDEGFKEYNFGAISGYFNAGEEGFGVFKMKENFGAVVYRTIGPLTKPLNSMGRIFQKRMV